jgi:cytochrome c oxidase subunit 2
VRNRPIVQLVAIGAIASAIGIVIALVIPWFPSNGSKQADNVHTLYDVLLIVSVPIAVLVITVVLYSVWNFRMRPGQELEDGPPIHGNTRLEIVWTAVPALLIVSLCTYAYTVLRSNEDSKKNEITVNITERQFAFQFAYPQAGGKAVISSQLYLAKDQPYVFKLRSYDVIHSFFVPDFSQKLDAVPGITTTLRVTPTRLGNYPAECTELCGAGHALMRAAVHVVTPQAFQQWLRTQPATTPPPVGTPPPNANVPPSAAGGGAAGAGAPGPSTQTTTTTPASTPPPSSGSATSPAAGKAVFTGSAGCGSCHTLAAAGTSGTVGPNLGTKPVPDSKKAGQPLKQFLSTSITNPNAFISPGFQPNIMPQTFSQQLSSTQVQALVNFIASVTK